MGAPLMATEQHFVGNAVVKLVGEQRKNGYRSYVTECRDCGAVLERGSVGNDAGVKSVKNYARQLSASHYEFCKGPPAAEE